MSNTDLHPTVEKFKSFINKHPVLVEKVRKDGSSWQEYYEKWILLDESDPYWEQFKKSEKDNQKLENKSEWIGQLMKLTENVDLKKVQDQVNQFSGTISTLQEILGEFQKKDKPVSGRRQFHWFKD